MILILSMTKIKEDLNIYFNSKNILLNKLKSSIKLSYGTKKLLDKLNENKQTYEEIILNLIEENKYLKNEMQSVISNDSNITFNTIQYERTKKLFSMLGFKITYSCNEGNYVDENFYFAVEIEEIIRNGINENLSEVYQELGQRLMFSRNRDENLQKIVGEYILYFMILTNLLMEKLNIKFTITNQFVKRLDYWDYNLNKLNISGKIKEKDINDKLDSFRVQLNQNEINKRK